MVTKVIKSVRVCDMCGDEKKHFIDGSGETINVNRGYTMSQSDRWDKTISFRVTASIPYQPNDDICTDCVREAMMQAIYNMESEQ